MHKKHMVKFGLCLGMLVFIVFAYSTTERVVNSTARALTPLEQVFMATGAELSDVSISGWVRVNSQKTDLEYLHELTISAAHELLDPESAVTCTTISGSGYTTVRAVNQTEKQNITVTAQAMEHPLEKPEVYLVIDIEKQDGTTDIGYFEQLILGIMHKNGDQFTITTCLSGWVNGKLEEEKMNQLVKLAFFSVNGRIIEGVNSPQFVSYAGITEAIDRSINIGKSRINLNVAMRYNNIEKRTYVTAATPIITHEY